MVWFNGKGRFWRFSRVVVVLGGLEWDWVWTRVKLSEIRCNVFEVWFIKCRIVFLVFNCLDPSGSERCSVLRCVNLLMSGLLLFVSSVKSFRMDVVVLLLLWSMVIWCWRMVMRMIVECFWVFFRFLMLMLVRLVFIVFRLLVSFGNWSLIKVVICDRCIWVVLVFEVDDCVLFFVFLVVVIFFCVRCSWVKSVWLGCGRSLR